VVALPLVRSEDSDAEMGKEKDDGQADALPSLALPRVFPSVSVAFFLFGISSWVSINGLWTQVALLIKTLPEGLTITTWMTLAIQIGNFLPLMILFEQGRRSLRGLRRLPESTIIISLLVMGILLLLFGSVGWQWQLVIGGGPGSSSRLQLVKMSAPHGHDKENRVSVVLLLVVLLIGAGDCATSIVYWPFVLQYLPAYLIAFSAGEAASGSTASILALLQGPPAAHKSHLRLSFELFLVALACVMSISLIAYIYILRSRKAKMGTTAAIHPSPALARSPSGIAESDSSTPVWRDADSLTASFHIVTTNGGGQQKEEKEGDRLLDVLQGGRGEVTATNEESEAAGAAGAAAGGEGDSGVASGGGAFPFEVILRFWPSFGLMAILNALGNGVFPALSSFAFAAYNNGNTALYYAGIVSIFLSPLSALLNRCTTVGRPPTQPVKQQLADEDAAPPSSQSLSTTAVTPSTDTSVGSRWWIASIVARLRGGGRASASARRLEGEPLTAADCEATGECATSAQGGMLFPLVWCVYVLVACYALSSSLVYPKPLFGLVVNGAWVMMSAQVALKCLASFLKTHVWRHLQASLDSQQDADAAPATQQDRPSAADKDSTAANDRYGTFRQDGSTMRFRGQVDGKDGEGGTADKGETLPAAVEEPVATSTTTTTTTTAAVMRREAPARHHRKVTPRDLGTIGGVVIQASSFCGAIVGVLLVKLWIAH